MIFDPLVEAWKKGTPSQRADATLELRNLSGTHLGWNRSGQETCLRVSGDGSLIYFRRGDFGERGRKPPGMWRGRCEPAEVDAIWKVLAGLSGKDFEGRAADPGDAITHFQARCGGLGAVLTWGPGEPGVPRRGVESLSPLRQLLAKAQAETLWNLRMDQGEIARVKGGIRIPLKFSNDGMEARSFLVSPPGEGTDFAFKYAADESNESGPALQINWVDAPVTLPGETGLRVAEAAPGADVGVELSIPVDLPPGGRFLGQVTYSQLELGEHLAGQPVFAGMIFTDIFKFETPR